MMLRSCSSILQRRFITLVQLALGGCVAPSVLLPACGGQSDAMSTDTGNPPVIIGQKLHVVPSDSGVVVSGDAGAVTPGASVAVENVTRGDERVTTSAPDGSFRVELEGTPEDEYRVEASLGGRTTSLSLDPSGSSPTALAGLDFLLDSSEGFTPVEGTTVRLSFEETEFGMSAGCNSMGGPYSLCDGKLCTSELITTDIGCAAPLHAQDEWLADFVRSQPSLTLSGDRLTLTGTDATLEFIDSEVAIPDSPLAGPTWSIDTLIDGGAASSFPPSLGPTMQFDDAGTVTIDSSCHAGLGSFAVSGGVLTLSDISYTDQVCDVGGDPAVAAHIEEVLSDGTVSFEIDEDRITLERGAIGISAVATAE